MKPEEYKVGDMVCWRDSARLGALVQTGRVEAIRPSTDDHNTTVYMVSNDDGEVVPMHSGSLKRFEPQVSKDEQIEALTKLLCEVTVQRDLEKKRCVAAEELRQAMMQQHIANIQAKDIQSVMEMASCINGCTWTYDNDLKLSSTDDKSRWSIQIRKICKDKGHDHEAKLHIFDLKTNEQVRETYHGFGGSIISAVTELLLDYARKDAAGHQIH